MSYLSIKDFINSGRKSLTNKNYWSALSVALILPSICSRIQFQEEEYEKKYWKRKEQGKKIWYDKKCYVDFCNSIMRVDGVDNGRAVHGIRDGYLSSILGPNYPETLYALRCDILHAGVINICDDNKLIILMLGEYASATELSSCRTIPIKVLCETIFNYIEGWNNNLGMNHLESTYVFDTENIRDDRLLYERLCSDARTDCLKEQFEKQITKERKL